MTATKKLHNVLEQRWKAAGQPPSATEQCLWDMQRVIDGSSYSRSLTDIMTEGVELLEAWIEDGDPATEEETAVIAQSKANIEAMSSLF